MTLGDAPGHDRFGQGFGAENAVVAAHARLAHAQSGGDLFDRVALADQDAVRARLLLVGEILALEILDEHLEGELIGRGVADHHR